MSTSNTGDGGIPVFRAVSSSARQLFQLLNCIRFAPVAQVQISGEGIRFSVEESRVMQGVAFLDKALFTSFHYNVPIPVEDDPETSSEPPVFQVSLTALLETLQIFGFSEASSRFSRPDQDGYGSNIRPGRPNALSNQALGMSGICRLSYSSLGAPLSIILEEANVTTTCNLHTYEPEAPEEIPFNREEVEVKIIMQSRFLFDAVAELSSITNTSSTSSARLIVVASPNTPYLQLSATGPLGSTSVEFAKSRELLETFTVSKRWTQSYKFEMVKAAADAMRLASKVSFRGDRQGVLSLQFMVELEGGAVSFVDYRFVPFARNEDDDTDGTHDDEDTEADDEFGE